MPPTVERSEPAGLGPEASKEAILAALRTSEERWRVAALVTNDAIWEWQLSTQRVRWGIGFQTLFGYQLDSDETDLAFWSDRVHPYDRERVIESLHIAADEGRPWCEEYRFLRADGTYAFVQDRGDVIRDSAGRVVQMVGGITDITLRKTRELEVRKENEELEARVRQRTSELEQAVRELDAFSYTVSHDLRAPLRAIDGYSRLIEEEYGAGLDATAHEYLERLRLGAQRMGRLIDDLLAFSRLSRQPITKVEIDMRALITRCVEELRAEQGERAVDVVVAPLPSCVGDPALLRQVWMNLLSNALKYSRARSPAIIHIDAPRDPLPPPGMHCYRIRDNGVGFDQRFAAKLFQVFQRLHTSDDFEGTGVGLAIVKRIVDRHGGSVGATGALDGGATFWITLPGLSATETDEASR